MLCFQRIKFLKFGVNITPNYNVSPNQNMKYDENLAPKLMNWGLKPEWMKINY